MFPCTIDQFDRYASTRYPEIMPPVLLGADSAEPAPPLP